MPDTTHHLALPYLAPAQAQKHVTHNEALRRIDAAVQLAVTDAALATPPGSPAEGDRYIVAADATGAWEGRDGDVAAFIDGAWEFLVPEVGWIAYDRAGEAVLVRQADGWEPLAGAGAETVERLGINTTADDPNRLAVRSNAVLFTGIEAGDGGTGDVRFIVNKEADGDTASLLFQSGFSGRAEVGLAGDTDFVFKVSPDGSAWTEAIRIDKDTGLVTIPYDNAASGLTATTVQDAIDELEAGGGGGGGVPPTRTVNGHPLSADVTVTKGDVGLGNADNTSDANKPVSTAQQTALDLKAPLASAGLTGNPTAPTQSQADNSTRLATTAYVRAAISAVLDGVSSAFDTLTEVATALAARVVGPASTTDSHVAQFDGTTGKLVKGGKAAPAGAFVGTTDTQTLTNKTLTAPAISAPTGLVKGDVGLGNVTNDAQVRKAASSTNGAIPTWNGTGGDALNTGGLTAPAGAIVGTTDTQTLTNKTLTAPAISSPTGLAKGDVGLGNADNTSDANKPVSTATQTALDLKAPLASPTFTGSVTLPGDPASALQAATKQYVDGLAANLGKRARVRVATTGNVTIATALNNGDSLDGVTLATGDHVLVKDQSSAAQNGVYEVGASPVRVAEFDAFDEHPGSLIAVQEGTANADTLWLCTSNAGGTLGSTALAFAQLAVGAGALVAANNLSDLANAATARTNLGLGTAATQATGTSGANVPLMDGANTWSAQQVASLTGSFAIPLIARSTNADAVAGPILVVDRNSASPANGDNIGAFQFHGRNSGGANRVYASIGCTINTATASSEASKFGLDAYVAGSQSFGELQIGGGVIAGSPTGSFKGYGTINATAVYDDNTLLTCFALSREFRETGRIDLARWDARAPERVIPGGIERRPVEIETGEDEFRTVSDPETGGYKRIPTGRKALAPAWTLVPIYDDKGNGIDAVVEPLYDEIAIPERREPRRHEVAHAFQAMLDDGFDPRQPAAYVARLRGDGALPGMPTEAEWEHNRLSSGELFMRLWLAAEMMALVIADHEDRIAAMEDSP